MICSVPPSHLSHGNEGSLLELNERYFAGRGHFVQAYILAFAYPSLIVIFRSSSFLKRTVCTPEIALTTVDLP